MTMVQLVGDVMTSDPVALSPDTPVRHAAKLMREQGIGDVLVVDGDRLKGIVTDRDIVIRAVADRDDLSTCTLRDVCSEHVITAVPDEQADAAIFRMRDNAVRRIPVVEGDRLVGVISLGDAALERDPNSALADISAAPANT
jgi:CBS domain-containing protein